MPFTPFHLGPASILALALLPYVSLPALLIGSIAPDIQPFIILFFNLPGTLHGPLLHSLISGTLLALPLTALVFILRKPIEQILSPLKLNQKQYSLTGTLAGALIGVYSHILIDSYLYTDIQPFYPLNWNPLLSHSESRYLQTYTACAISFIAALTIYGFYLWKKHDTANQPPP